MPVLQLASQPLYTAAEIKFWAYTDFREIIAHDFALKMPFGFIANFIKLLPMIFADFHGQFFDGLCYTPKPVIFQSFSAGNHGQFFDGLCYTPKPVISLRFFRTSRS